MDMMTTKKADFHRVTLILGSKFKNTIENKKKTLQLITIYWENISKKKTISFGSIKFELYFIMIAKC